MADIPEDEQRLLERVKASLAARATTAGQSTPYDQDLVSLRDEIGEARLEDVPALIAQMERLQGVSLRRAEAQGVLVDPQSPYFGHLRLREQVAGRGDTERDIFIGRSTFVDPAARVNIVDWRHAPVSQLYYRYAEGSDYEERFGEREVEGEVLVRRTVTIDGGVLRRIECPQGVFTRASDGGGEEASWERHELTTAELAGGEGSAVRATGPLLSRAQQSGGRGVLGAPGPRHQRLDRHLPEIAALIDPRQFELITALDSGVVVIQGGAGSGKTTIGLHRIAYLAFNFPKRLPANQMLVVTFGAALAAYISQVLPSLGIDGVRVATFETWATKELRHAVPWLDAPVVDDAPAAVRRLKSHPGLLHALEDRARAFNGRKTSRAVVTLWAELLTDRALVASILGGPSPEVSRYLEDRASAVLDRDPAQGREKETRTEDDEIRGATGIDGLRTDDAPALLDLEDVAILLRLHQLLRGSKRLLSHLFVDEAQDLSPLELAVLLGQTTSRRSVTLAGDTAQRLFLDNGFDEWRSVLGHLDLAHVAIEPLRIAYRSTREILQLARHVMGPLADPQPPAAPRTGAPVEAHTFPGTGAAVAFIADALRGLLAREPRATVAVLARHAEQSDRYFDGLRRAEVPSLRRIRAQEFAFRPGVEVTEIRQVKGLEFDYVIIVDANASTFGQDDESRHLLHIAATRAAHQLWLIVTGPPSALLPAELLA